MCPLQWRQFSHPSCVESDKWSGPHLSECSTNNYWYICTLRMFSNFNPILYSYDYTIRKWYKLILDNDHHSCALQCVLFRYSVIPCFAACSFQAFGYFNTIACTPTSKSSCTWLLRVKGRSKEETGILRQECWQQRACQSWTFSHCVSTVRTAARPSLLCWVQQVVLSSPRRSMTWQMSVLEDAVIVGRNVNIVVFTKTKYSRIY